MIKLNGGGLFQWEIDREITVTDVDFDELHFDNVFLSKALVTKPANSSGGVIPNVLLQFASPVTVYAVKDGKVLEATTFEVTAKAKPEDYFIFDENDYSGIIALLSGEETTPSIAGVHDTLTAVNALGVKALANKGVTVHEDATTEQIIQGITRIESGQETSNAFWDEYQQYGNRAEYSYGFAGAGWSDNNFKPKHNIVPVGNSVRYMFSSNNITNLKALLEECGVILDFSQVTNCNYPFQGSTITDVGILDVRKCNEFKYFLYGSKNLKNIEKLVLKSDGSQVFDTTYSFGTCNALTHIIFEGAIGSNINTQWSPLDLESAISIINALVNYSGTADAFTYTVKFSSHTTELLNAAGNTAPNGGTWLEYIVDKGWTNA